MFNHKGQAATAQNLREEPHPVVPPVQSVVDRPQEPVPPQRA
jgi:hypothetical protein